MAYLRLFAYTHRPVLHRIVNACEHTHTHTHSVLWTYSLRGMRATAAGFAVQCTLTPWRTSTRRHTHTCNIYISEKYVPHTLIQNKYTTARICALPVEARVCVWKSDVRVCVSAPKRINHCARSINIGLRFCRVHQFAGVDLYAVSMTW